MNRSQNFSPLSAKTKTVQAQAPGLPFLSMSYSQSASPPEIQMLCPGHVLVIDYSKEARRTLGHQMPLSLLKLLPGWLPWGLWTWLYEQPEPLCQPHSKSLFVPGVMRTHSRYHMSHFRAESSCIPIVQTHSLEEAMLACSRESQLSLGPTPNSL